jgi:hypothetical protein
MQSGRTSLVRRNPSVISLQDRLQIQQMFNRMIQEGKVHSSQGDTTDSSSDESDFPGEEKEEEEK